jgi:hypothetical protein
MIILHVVKNVYCDRAPSYENFQILRQKFFGGIFEKK